MNQHVQSPEPGTMVIGAGGALRRLRFDPDGASIGPEIPDELLARWTRMLADCGKAQGRMHRSYERFFKEQEACINALHGLVDDAVEISGNVRDLAELMASALADDSVPAPLAEALRLVLDCLGTMADRLEALGEHGDAARESCRV